MSETAISIARKLARHVFAKRGNHAEAHLSEMELGAIIALGIELAMKQCVILGRPSNATLRRGIPDGASVCGQKWLARVDERVHAVREGDSYRCTLANGGTVLAPAEAVELDAEVPGGAR